MPFYILTSRHDVIMTKFHQCMYGLKPPRSDLMRESTLKVGKYTITDSNRSQFVHLNRMCDGNHPHQVVEGKARGKDGWIPRSVHAGAYPVGLCTQWAKCFCDAA